MDTLQDIFNWLMGLMESTVWLLVSLALLGFLWGILKYFVKASNPGNREESKKFMAYGILSLFVIVSLWGLVVLVGSLFGINLRTSSGDVFRTTGNVPSSSRNIFGTIVNDPSGNLDLDATLQPRSGFVRDGGSNSLQIGSSAPSDPEATREYTPPVPNDPLPPGAVTEEWIRAHNRSIEQH